MEPNMSKRSFCMTLAKRTGALLWIFSFNCISTECTCASEAFPCFWRSCTLERTSMASLSRPFVSFMSDSSAWNAAYSLSRVETAVARASWSSAMSLLREAICVFSSPSVAEASSMKALSCSILAWAEAIASPFSLSLVLHQHIYLSYAARSSEASFSTCSFISSMRVTTLRTGLISAEIAELGASWATAAPTSRSATAHAVTVRNGMAALQ
mmetsp:Transcript_23602/g.60157  ORF Transcript_23602/g.60157 Transcript_23602/m.60157 type:complete len:212 (-) Transcript_23602:52-687(-)